jgi:hypothetical protein
VSLELFILEVWVFGGVILPCFFVFLLLVGCDLDICFDGYLFQVCQVDFLVSNLLFRAQSLVPSKEDKTTLSAEDRLDQSRVSCQC